MSVGLQRVTEELAARTGAAAEGVQRLLLDATDSGGPDLHARIAVTPMGSSAHPGCLSRGDVDVLAVVPRSLLAAAVTALRDVGRDAQPENWTGDFASFAVPGERLATDDGASEVAGADPVGVQVVVEGTQTHHELVRNQQRLADPAFRARYDVLKQHAAGLSAVSYWRAKDVFWHTLEAPGPSWTPATTPVLKVLTAAQWSVLRAEHELAGAPVDLADGFVHLSTPDQVGETVTKHFTGQDDLWLLTLDADELGDDLRWEPSRGGDLFPHLYAPLRLADIHLVRPWA